nr:hypothetical protein [Tanacetum cinerariifolium]
MLTRAIAKELSVALDHECLFVDFLSEDKPKKVFEALKHPRWVVVMQDELNQFARNKVLTLVPTPYGIYYDETLAPVARLEAIRSFLGFSTYMNFIVYQMDVKSAFLNGKLKEEVYVKQPLGFESSEFPNHVCKLDKGLYELKQALRACFFHFHYEFASGCDTFTDSTVEADPRKSAPNDSISSQQDSTVEADPRKSAPNDSISSQQVCEEVLGTWDSICTSLLQRSFRVAWL